MKSRLAIVLVWAVVWGSNLVLPAWYEQALLPPREFRTLPDMLLDVLGEGRTILARILWFKMDLYHEILDAQEVPHTKQTEIMPLLRLVTLLDPHIDEAYDILAYDLYVGHKDYNEALKVLDEGIAYNPESYELRFRRAWILYKQDRFAEAIPDADKALHIASNEFEAMNAIRILSRCLIKEKKYAAAIQVLDIWIGLRPSNQVPKDLRQTAEEELKLQQQQ